MGHTLTIELRQPSVPEGDATMEQQKALCRESAQISEGDKPARDSVATYSNGKEKPVGEKATDAEEASGGRVETNVVESAKRKLVEDLADVFLKDVRNRIVGPAIYDFQNAGAQTKRDKKGTSLSKTKQQTTQDTSATTNDNNEPISVSKGLEPNVEKSLPSLSKLPQIKKRKSSPVKDAEPVIKKLCIEDSEKSTSSVGSPNVDTESSNHLEEEDSEAESPGVRLTSSRRKGTTAGLVRKMKIESSESEDEFQEEELPKKKRQKQRKRPGRPKKTILEASTSKVQSPANGDKYTEDQDEGDEEESVQVRTDTPVKQEEEYDTEQEMAMREQAVLVSEESEEEEEPICFCPEEVEQFSKVEEWDPFNQVQDSEDFEFLRNAIYEKMYPEGLEGLCLWGCQ